DTVSNAYCTTRDAAKILGVSVRSVQVWVEKGLLRAWKTEGGHRRVDRPGRWHLPPVGRPGCRRLCR
ncbi:MAG: helix-turn-helix domain-containing protein, partial [Sphingomonas sp.]|nr:helix-turn-helix domain-containing protein [Sphingomonas sp.]